MALRDSASRRRLRRLLFLGLVGWGLAALWRNHDLLAEPQPQPVELPPPRLPVFSNAPKARASRRLAATLALTVLFFAGASFSAMAGDNVALLLETEDTVAAEVAEPAPVVETAPAPEPVEATQGPEEVAPARAGDQAPPPPVTAEEPEPVVAEVSVDTELVRERHSLPAAGEPATPRTVAATPAPKRPQPVRAARPQVSAAAAPALDPEASAPGSVATVWLNRDLGDPTPASLRLAPGTARRLVAAAHGAGADWALVLGVLRADGSRALPARAATFTETAGALGTLEAGEGWAAALALTGRTAAADRAVALARYYRAVGLTALVDGLLARQEALATRLLADERVDLLPAGRADVAAGRIDVRVLALIAYLAEAYGQVTVSSLRSGHRLYARPGVVSAHVYGQAVDIAALGGTSVAGHQEPGGLTERAVRDILLLPAEVRPRQLISLLGLGGPSFPLADHADHIHVGY